MGHKFITDRRLTGVQGAHLLAQRIEYDLKRIYWSPRHPIRIEPPPKASIRFFIFDAHASAPANLDIRVKSLRYSFDPKKKTVIRTEQGGGSMAFRDRYERIAFGHFPNDGKLENTPLPYVQLPPYGAPAPPVETNPNLVFYQITCTPPEVLDLSPEERRPEDRTTLSGAVLIPNKATSEKYHFWIPNRTSFPTSRSGSGTDPGERPGPLGEGTPRSSP